MISHSKLSEIFVEVADSLVTGLDVVDFLHNLTDHAASVSDAAAVGILLADHDGQLRFMAASDQDSRSLELYQLQVAEGRAWTPSGVVNPLSTPTWPTPSVVGRSSRPVLFRPGTDPCTPSR